MAKYEVPSTSVFREKDYNVKKLIIAHYYHNNFLQMTQLYYKHVRNIRAKSGALCW